MFGIAHFEINTSIGKRWITSLWYAQVPKNLKPSECFMMIPPISFDCDRYYHEVTAESSGWLY